MLQYLILSASSTGNKGIHTMSLDNNPENNIGTKLNHSGNAPEAMREIPENDFDNTSLREAVDQGLITVPETTEAVGSWTPSTETTPSTIEKKGFSKKQKLIATLSGAALALGLGVGIKSMTSGDERVAPAGPVATAPATTPNTAETTTTPTSAEKARATMSDNERLYATYLDALTPAQKAERAALDPNVLVTQSDAEITKSFTITPAEITGPDGKIDPAKFAEAWAARQQGLVNAGSSLQEWPKLGGLDNYSMDTCTQIANKYVPVMGEAVYGHDLQDKLATANTCFRFAAIESLKTLPGQAAIESYHVRVVPFKDTTPNIAPNPDGSFKVNLREITSDNWDEAAVRAAISVDAASVYRETDWNITVAIDKASDKVTIIDSAMTNPTAP